MARSDCEVCRGRGTITVWVEERNRPTPPSLQAALRLGPPTATKRDYACPECSGYSPGVEIIGEGAVIDKSVLMAVRSEELIARVAATTAHRLLERLNAAGRILFTVDENNPSGSGPRDKVRVTVRLAVASKHAAETAQLREDEIYKRGAFDAIKSMVGLIEALTPLHTAAGIVLREAEGGGRGRRTILQKEDTSHG